MMVIMMVITYDGVNDYDGGDGGGDCDGDVMLMGMKFMVMMMLIMVVETVIMVVETVMMVVVMNSEVTVLTIILLVLVKLCY